MANKLKKKKVGRPRKKKKAPPKNRNPLLYRLRCPFCDASGMLLVRRSLSAKKSMYGRCNQCAALVFGEDAVLTYTKKNRYMLEFESITWPELELLLRNVEDFTYKQHPQYTEPKKVGRKKKDVNG